MALTKVGPAGIGSTPGTGYVIGDSFLHATGLNATNAYYTGIVTAQTFRVIGDFQVDGTTTTLDTVVTEVDKLEVAANNTTVAVAVTQSGSGDILRLYDGSSQVVTVDDEGQIGIGANAPSANLDIADTGFVNVKVRTSGNNSATLNLQNSQRNFSVNNISGGAFTIHDGTASAERFRITSGGNVGIGTENPTAPLTVMSSSDPEIKFGYKESQSHTITWDSSKLFLNADPGNANGSSALGFRVDGTERLRITSAGNLGIGIDDPQAKAHVYGSPGALFENSTGNNISVRTHVGNGNDAHINIDKSRGGSGVATTSLDGDKLGTLGFRGYTANGDYSAGAQIIAAQVGDAGSDFIGGRLTFRTTNTDGTERTAIVIDPDQLVKIINNDLHVENNLGIGITNPQANLHIFEGTGSTQAPALLEII